MSIRMFKYLMYAAPIALAGGCVTKFNGAEHALTYQEEHPITVDSQTITMTVAANGAGLTSLDAARVRAFANAYSMNGHGPVTITAPSGPSANTAADATAANIRKALYDNGLDYGSIRTANYVASEAGGSDIVVSYTHYVATASECGIWEDLRERDYRNMRSPNFGCATQNNLAAMIGDPHDLIAPADMTDPDAIFRIRGVKAFRAGEITATARDSDIEADTEQ